MKVISKITLTTKRNKRKLPRMEIAVTTCGVMSLERRATKPIRNARSVTKPMKRVQEKRWTCLGADTLEGALSCWEAVLSTRLKDGEWRSVGMIWWFISESVWWFKSNNKIVRDTQDKGLKILDEWSEIPILALDTTALSIWQMMTIPQRLLLQR